MLTHALLESVSKEIQAHFNNITILKYIRNKEYYNLVISNFYWNRLCIDFNGIEWLSKTVFQYISQPYTYINLCFTNFYIIAILNIIGLILQRFPGQGIFPDLFLYSSVGGPFIMSFGEKKTIGQIFRPVISL